MTADSRFWEKVDVRGPDDCWPWTGGITGSGHGVIWVDGRLVGAHVFAYQLAFGAVPEGLDVGHECHDRDVTCPGGVTCPHRACVNSRHLKAQSRLENLRAGRGLRRTQTHCKWDHEFTPENTRWVKSRGLLVRRCIECERRRGREGYARRKAASCG